MKASPVPCNNKFSFRQNFFAFLQTQSARKTSSQASPTLDSIAQFIANCRSLFLTHNPASHLAKADPVAVAFGPAGDR
jgi:hypothetical protein